VEVEVVFLNLLGTRGLVAGGLRRSTSSSLELLHGPMEAGEHPADSAVRLLEDVAGITTGLHQPEFVGFATHPDRQSMGATLTLTFAVLGRTPTNSRSEWTHSLDVDETSASLDGRVNHPGSVRAGRRVICRLLETRPLALDVMNARERSFLLHELHAVYSMIFGPEVSIDLANFRRKVERATGFVRRVTLPGPQSFGRRGRPAHWYEAGPAKEIVPPLRFDMWAADGRGM
jgi:hypothetical protein